MIHDPSKVPRHHRRRANPVARPERRLPIPRQVLRIGAVRSNLRVVVRISHDALEGRRVEHGAGCSGNSDCDGRVKGIFEQTRRDDRVAERIGRIDVNMPAREGHQGPEGGEEGGASTISKEFDDRDCRAKRRVSIYLLRGEPEADVRRWVVIRSMVVLSTASAPRTLAAAPTSTRI